MREAENTLKIKNQYVNEVQQRKPWPTRNINATQVQNKNKTSKRNTEKHTPLVSNTTAHKSHEDIDILSIQVEAKTSTPKPEN